MERCIGKAGLNFKRITKTWNTVLKFSVIFLQMFSTQFIINKLIKKVLEMS